MRRYKNWAHKINCRKYLCEDTEWQWIVLQKHCLLVLQPLKAQRDSFLISTLKSSQGDWRSAAAAARFNPCRWQVPICSWQWRCFLPILKMWKQPLEATLACPRHRDPAHLHAMLWSWVPPIHTGCAAQRGQRAKLETFHTVLAALWLQSQNPRHLIWHLLSMRGALCCS